MKPRDLFSLAVRLLGLYFVCVAARTLPVTFSVPPPQVVAGTLLTVAFHLGPGQK